MMGRRSATFALIILLFVAIIFSEPFTNGLDLFPSENPQEDYDTELKAINNHELIALKRAGNYIYQL